MTNPVRLWNAFWFRPVSARPLGAFRVSIGVLTLVHLGLLAFDLDYWLTDRGIMTGTEAREVAGPLRFSPLQYVQDPASVRTFFAATVALAGLFTLGWRTRPTGVLLYLAMLSIHHRNIPTNCGPDNLLLIFLFYLMLSPCGAAFSLDARRLAKRRGTPAEPLIVPWAQRLIQLQMGLVYFNTAVLKCHGATWLGGTSLHYVLNNPEVTRFDFTFLSAYPSLLNLLAIGTIFIEFALPFLIWFRPTRALVIVGGLALHGGILLTINVPIFGELMAASYLTFLAPDEFAALDPRRLLRTHSRRPARAVTPPGRFDAAAISQGTHSQTPVGERVSIHSPLHP